MNTARPPSTCDLALSEQGFITSMRAACRYREGVAARMERSAIRDRLSPDCAALHPAYSLSGRNGRRAIGVYAQGER
jgi:hypothetical protein